MKNYISIFVAIFCSVIGLEVKGQGEILFTSGKDLSSSMINSIFQDSDGLVWVGSEDGLDLYDGVSFRHIRHCDGDSLSLLSNYVRFVFQSQDLKLFVGTLHGLQYFDRSSLKFHSVPVVSNGDTISIRPSVSSMCQISDSVYIVGTSGYGVMKLTGSGNRFCMSTDSNIGNGSVQCIYKEPSGNIWISYGNRGVKVINPLLEIIGEIKLPDLEQVNAIASGPEGYIWLGTSKGRVLRCNSISPFQYTEIVSTVQNQIAVLCLYNDNDSTMLIGTDGHGIKKIVFDGDVYKIKEYELSVVDNSHLKVHSIICDRDSNYWIGCFQKGVLLKRNGSSMFDYIGCSSLHHNVIGQCCVMSIYNDNHGNMYVGTDNDGIYVLDSCYNLKQHLECDKPNTFVPRVTLSMCCDSYHRLWVGGYLGGLVWLDLNTGIWHRYEQASFSAGNDFSSIYSIVEDSVAQTLWISASGIGIYKIDEKTLESKLFTVNYTSLQHNYTTNQICNPWVINMMISSDRKLYIGTFSGFSCMDLDTESFISTYGVNCFMEGYVVNSICESPDHHIWIGTTEGLYDFDVNTRKFRSFETKDGLINTSVSGVSSDADGNIWISSKAGISCLYSDSKNIVNFNSSDGLYSNEFMSNAVSKAQNGKISFGAVNGVVCFMPFETHPNKNNLNLRIVNFVVDNKTISKGVKSGGHDVVDTAVVHAKKFHLSPWDNSFEIEFSVMVYGNSDNIKYSYRVDGGEWSTISGNRVSFAKMGYGVHTLEARATDNVNTSQVLSVEIVIDYPWYRSTWFYLLLTLLGICVAILTYVLVKRRIQLNRHLEELSHDKELNDSRLEYFTNISHEIRTPISLIISPLYKLLNSDLDPVRQRSYKVINVNAQRILNLINQLLDLRKIDSAQLKLEFEKTDLVSFCKGIYESFELYASNLGVKFELETEDDSIDAYIDPKHFDKVIVNLLSNAFKYTPANGKVTLSLVRLNDNMVEISVSDEGAGLSEEDAAHIFDLFYQGSNNHKITMVGTGVGMFLARKLVTMHHGTIKATNNPEGSKGCSFVINLPLGRAHLSDDEIYVRSEQDKMKYMPMSGMDTNDDEELKQYAKTSTRIVLVDDDDQMRQYIIDELGKYFHFTDFAKASEALMYITKNKPDLVISDVMMDDMNGMTLCKKIKQNVEINTIPVILLTAAAQDNSRIKALDLGSDAYITKPFNISVLSHTITNLLKRNNTLKNNYLGRQDRTSNSKEVTTELNSPDDKLLQRVLKVIDENMSNQNLTVNMIAETVGISRVHLHRKLKELTNQSTIDFLRNVRLNKALKLLRIKHISILEVAQQVGFGSTSYFSAVFKERFGCTPSAYMSENFNVEVDTNLPDDVTKMFQNL